jgi:acyl-CoA thioesterase I
MNRYLIIIPTIIVIAITLYFLVTVFMPKENVVELKLKEGPIVAFGDSLIRGLGSTSGNDMVSVLSDKIGEKIVNLGISGDTTTTGLQRVDRVLELRPSVVILLLGGNDFLRRVPRETTFQNLEQIITRLQEEGIVVILVGVRGGLFTDEFRGDFERLSKKHNTFFVPNILDGIIGNESLMSDPIHPNNKGYALMAEKIYPVLMEVIK